jgi:PAS domain S-box-containing protein
VIPDRAPRLFPTLGPQRGPSAHGLVLGALLLAFLFVAQAVGADLVRDSGAGVSFFVPLLAVAVASAAALFWHREERLTWSVLTVALVLGAAAESAIPMGSEAERAMPLAAAVAYGAFCAASGAMVLAASGDFRFRRAFAQGLGVCAFGLATVWTWFFLAPAGSSGETLHSSLDLLLALAVLAALCNHGWPMAPRFAMLACGFALVALADSLQAQGVMSGVFGMDLADALPFAGAALIAAVACLGIGPTQAGERSGRFVVITSSLAMVAALDALVYDHYSRLSSGTVLLASLTMLAAALQLTIAQRGWRDARARTRAAERASATELPGLDAAIAIGPDGRIVSCNSFAPTVFRRGEMELVGKSVGNLLDGGAGDRSFEDLLADVDEGSLPVSVELSAYDTYGVSFPVEVAIGPVQGQAAVRALVVRDISERRRREEENRRLAAIVRSSEDAVLTKDLTGVVTAWNQGAERLYGYRPDEAIGRHVTELIVPADRRPEAKRVLSEVGAGDTLSFETERTTKSGDWIDVALRTFPIRGVSGEVTAVCSVAHDISDRRRRERAEAWNTEAVLWRRRLRRALDQDGAGELVFHGQPILDLRRGAIHHHELLVRMRLEEELIQPGAFLPYAEEGELIRDLDLWAVERGITLGAELPVAINLSARSLGSRGLLAAIERRLGGNEALAENLTFEITETAAAENMDGARELVGELNKMGCAVALDDFGTGYGSFTYLRHLPVTQLKIDIEFIRGIAEDSADRRVVESMIDVARNFEMTTVAEGVEDQRTLEMVRELGVDLAQGYHVGRPQPVGSEGGGLDG